MTDDVAAMVAAAVQAIADADIALLEVSVVAKHLRCSARTVHRYIAAGWLPAVRLPGNHVRVKRVALAEFVARHSMTNVHKPDSAPPPL